MQPGVERDDVEPGFDDRCGIEEVRPVEYFGGRAVSGRGDHLAELRTQFGQRLRQVDVGRLVGSQAEVGLRHQSWTASPGRSGASARERFRITPTAFAPRTAPTLLNFSLTLATPNSSMMMRQHSSASASTRP